MLHGDSRVNLDVLRTLVGSTIVHGDNPAGTEAYCYNVTALFFQVHRSKAAPGQGRVTTVVSAIYLHTHLKASSELRALRLE